MIQQGGKQQGGLSFLSGVNGDGIPLRKLNYAMAAVILVLSLLLGMHMGFRRMSVLDVILMVVPLAVGVGLVLRGLFTKE